MEKKNVSSKAKRTAKKLNDSKSRTLFEAKGKVFVFTGPSGAGKTTIANIILKEMNFFKKIVTYTTRKIREGEIDGVSYNFVSKKKFEEFLKKDLLLEYATVYDNYYGSLRKDVEKVISTGKSVMFVVDVQGALTIKKKFSAAITVFIKTPSLEVLRVRLEKRAKDSKEVIEKRMKTAEEELKIEDKFDYIIVNDELDRAVKEMNDLIYKSLN